MGRRAFGAVVVLALVAAAAPVAAGAAGGERGGVRPQRDATEVPLLESETPEETVPPAAAPAAWSPVLPLESREVGAIPQPRRELVERRDAFTRVFENGDGSLTIDAYTEPIHYETPVGDWELIDNTFEADPSRPGWVVVDDNRWTTAFGPATDGLRLESPAGAIQVRPVTATISSSQPPPADGSESPAEAQPGSSTEQPAPHTEEAAGSRPEVARAPDTGPASEGGGPIETAAPNPGVVWYRDVWPGVDLRYVVSGNGVKEEVVLDNPDAGNEFAFDISGAQLVLREDGGIDLTGALGALFEIPAPTVLDVDGVDLTAGSGARFELRPGAGEGAQRLALVVGPAWLESVAAEAFPLRIDPSFVLVNPHAAITYDNNNLFYTGTPISIGRQSSGLVYRAGLHFGQYEPYLTGRWRVYNAQLQFGGQTATSPPITVYDQGASPTSFGVIGTDRPVVEGQWDGPFLNVSKEMDNWVTQGLADRWFGVRTVESGVTFRSPTVRMILYIFQPPQQSFVTNIADQQVLASTTPTLSSQPVPFAPDDPPVHPWHEFQITTSPAPNSGLVLSSGMIEQTSATQGVSWAVPQGALQEGLTYYAWVLTNFPQYGGPPPATVPSLELGRRFTVDLGLGEGGPSPTDEVGSVPGQASSPSEGAPGPSLPGSKVTVNLVDGNLSLSVGTRTAGTLSGGVALGFTYNSLALGNQGLNAEFFNDTNASGAIDAGDVQVASRVDPTVNFDWGFGILAKPVASIEPAAALGRWTGNLTVPSATTRTWQLGAISSDGLRGSVGGTLRLDQWAAHEPQAGPEFGSSFTASSATPLPLSIEWRNTTGRGVARVYLRDVTNPSTPITYNLSPAWLTRQLNSLPQGWTLNAAAGAAGWVGLQDRGTSVSMYAADGTAHEFKSAGNGAYTPPIGAPNDLLALGNDGRFVLRDAGGATYTFRADGVLESLVTAGDDLNPAALVYGYSGMPVRLRTITDPVSNRVVNLSYGGDPACAGAPVAGAGLLCHIGFWDGTATTLTYDTAGRFIRLTNPGGIVHDFAYDFVGRLIQVRDPLAVDAIAAGVATDDVTSLTRIHYDSAGRVERILQPRPISGQVRPERTYTYDPANRTGSVQVAGFSPTVGFAQRNRYDTRNRIVESTGPDGLSATYGWDSLDRLVSVTDTAGLRTTTFYDHASRPVTTFGPAPVASFQADGLPAVGATVPTATRAYDGGIDGLGAAYWTNPFLAGGPELHDTGLGVGGAMDRDWDTTLPVTPGPGGWSARYSGYFEVTTAGGYLFQASTRGSAARVWVDEVLVADHAGPEPPSGFAATTGTAATLAAGEHRIRVDMVDTSGPAGLRVLWKPATTGTFTVLAGSLLSPNYGLVTGVTDPDGKVSVTEFADPAAGIGPHHGLATATVADPAGANLRSTIGYESPGAGSYLRRLARTLPAGNTWTTLNYGGTEGPAAAVCGVAGGTPQGGMPKRVTGPDPDGPGAGVARVEEFVYDTIGRQVGRRVGDTATITAAGWSCTSYDARGRITSQTAPVHGAAVARTTTYTYAVGGNPLVNRITDSTWGTAFVGATVDLLGRTVSYTDIYGSTTTTAFDQAGRQTSTSGPLGVIAQNYDPDIGRPTTTVTNGITAATPTYDSVGRLSAVAYLNGSATVHSYDTYGRPNGLGVFDLQGVTGETVTRSLAGRIIDQNAWDGTGFVDANPAGPNYTYDGAGRLTSAVIPGAGYTYGYGTAPGCAAPDAGANTNRTSLTVTGVGATSSSSCYDHADRLVSTTAIPAGAIVYDDHGNTVRLGEEYLEFDSADRHVRTETPTHVTNYRRDPLDRIVERADTPRVSHVATTTATTGAATVSVARPAGTQAGDLIVASISVNGLLQPGGVSAAGWTNAAQQTNLTNRTAVLWRYATGSDPASWAFTAANSTASTGALSTYRATAGSTPIITTGVASALLATSHPVPQVNTATDAAQLVHATGFSGSTGAGAPAGTTQRASIAAGASLLVSDRSKTDPGPSVAVAVTSGGSRNSASVTVAIAAVTTTVRYGHIGHSDSSPFTTTPAGTLSGYTIALVGGTAFTWSATLGFGFSHANLHGDTVTVTDLAANRTWAGLTGPYGEPASSTTPANTGITGTRWGWHGQQQRLTDRNIIHMGARPYSPTHGRFLAVDPIEGGCANTYVYGFGDPVQGSDLTGTEWWDPRDWGDEIAGAADWLWDRTGGKVFTCDDNGVTAFIETFGLIPTVSGTDREIRDGAARYTATSNIGAVLTGLNYLIQRGALQTSARLASRIATAASGVQGVVYLATAYQVGRYFAC